MTMANDSPKVMATVLVNDVRAVPGESTVGSEESPAVATN